MEEYQKRFIESVKDPRIKRIVIKPRNSGFTNIVSEELKKLGYEIREEQQHFRQEFPDSSIKK